MANDDEAIVQFNTSSIYPLPDDFDGSHFEIRNNYPKSSTETRSDHPWLNISFKDRPKEYLETLLKYCFKGMPQNDFVVQNNQERDWYHAPWMHYHQSGREPIHGLTCERSTPPKELSATQNRHLQTWACAYYNALGAALFAQVWENQARPSWNDDVQFPEGSVVFKVLMTDATDDELPFMKDSPKWEAVIAKEVDGEEPNPKDRNTTASTVRLLQVDVATRDNSNSLTGWIFGTFVYDGRGRNEGEATTLPFPDPGWYRLLPIGLMWGNDPVLTQARFMNGNRPVEHWINPVADVLFQQLNADRHWWGWNGRMNGPADDFISACSSCHSVAQKLASIDEDEFGIIIPPFPEQDKKDQFIPEDDKKTMEWFRNLKDERFNKDAPSGDYSLQLMMGFNNYQRWRAGREPGYFSLRRGRQNKK